MRSVDSGCAGRVIEPRKKPIAGADAVPIAEGDAEASYGPDAEVPPGSESGARTQGLSRNLGGPVVSIDFEATWGLSD